MFMFRVFFSSNMNRHHDIHRQSDRDDVNQSRAQWSGRGVLYDGDKNVRRDNDGGCSTP